MRMMMAKINDIILSGQKNPFVKEKKNEEHRQIQNQHDLNNLSSKKKKKFHSSCIMDTMHSLISHSACACATRRTGKISVFLQLMTVEFA